MSLLTSVLEWQTTDWLTINASREVQTKLLYGVTFCFIFLHQDHQKFVWFTQGYARPCLFKKRSTQELSSSNIPWTQQTWIDLRGTTRYPEPWNLRACKVPQKASVASNHWRIVQAGMKFSVFYAQSVPMIILPIVGTEMTASLLSLWAQWRHGLFPPGLMK